MLKLARLPDKFKNDYVAARNAHFDEAERKASFDPAATKVPWAQAFIDHLRANRNQLHGGTPAELKAQVNAIETHPEFGEFARYCNPRPRGKAKRKGMEALCKLVEKLFDYRQMSKGTGPTNAHGLVAAHSQRICPYCQMHHVNFHMTPRDWKMRPPLDHFYPRSIYPYLATSLYNLVPCCEQCNSRIKLAKNPLAEKLAHPFESSPALSFISGWKPLVKTTHITRTDDFQFSFGGACGDSKKFADFFKLGRRYEWYNHELLDMVRRHNSYMDMSLSLVSVIDRVEYVAGFPEKEAQKRAVGLFLLDAAKAMK